MADKPAPKLPQEEIDKILKALHERGALLPCPRCGNPKFSIAPGYFANLLQPSPASLILGGIPNLPTVAIACEKCGWLAHHALGALGLMPAPKAEETSETPTPKAAEAK